MRQRRARLRRLPDNGRPANDDNHDNDDVDDHHANHNHYDQHDHDDTNYTHHHAPHTHHHHHHHYYLVHDDHDDAGIHAHAGVLGESPRAHPQLPRRRHRNLRRADHQREHRRCPFRARSHVRASRRHRSVPV